MLQLGIQATAYIIIAEYVWRMQRMHVERKNLDCKMHVLGRA